MLHTLNASTFHTALEARVNYDLTALTGTDSIVGGDDITDTLSGGDGVDTSVARALAPMSSQAVLSALMSVVIAALQQIPSYIPPVEMAELQVLTALVIPVTGFVSTTDIIKLDGALATALDDITDNTAFWRLPLPASMMVRSTHLLLRI